MNPYNIYIGYETYCCLSDIMCSLSIAGVITCKWVEYKAYVFTAFYSVRYTFLFSLLVVYFLNVVVHIHSHSQNFCEINQCMITNLIVMILGCWLHRSARYGPCC